MNLDPFTEYTITVTCVNAAGLGNTSTPMMIKTNSARKYHFVMPSGVAVLQMYTVIIMTAQYGTSFG